MRLRFGAKPTGIPSLAEAVAHEWTAAETAFVTERNNQQAIGDIDHVTGRIRSLVEATGATEVIVVPQGPDLATKLRTLREVATLAR